MRKYIRNIVVILSMVMSGLLLGGCNHESVSSDVQGNDIQVYRKPIVALLDTSCEANFENVFWNNDDEIPNNHIDDDNNGYVDDLNGWDFVDDSSEVISDEFDNHGSCMLNIMQSEYADFMILRVLNDSEAGSVKNVIEAIEYAEKNGATICNLSFITLQNSQELKNVMSNSSMLFVVSAGNFGENLNITCEYYPVCCQLPNMITVASCDENGKLIAESNYGDKYVDVAAVSDNVSVELSDGEIIILSGTSVAAANVTKVAYYISACSSVDMDSKSLKNRMCATLILDEDCKNMVRYGGIISLEDVLKYIK